MTAGEVIASYHLWHVDASFRMSKRDLRARPIFHHTCESIDSYLTTVFIALAVARHLQDETRMSIKKIVTTLRPLQQVNVRIADHDHLAEDPPRPSSSGDPRRPQAHPLVTHPGGTSHARGRLIPARNGLGGHGTQVASPHECHPRTAFLRYTLALDRYPRRNSCTSAVREAVQCSEHALKDMRHVRAGARPPADFCVDGVRNLDILVCLIGVRYGETVPEPGDQRSYLEREFEAATEAGLPGPVFMLDPQAELRIPRSERNTDDESRLREFRGRLMSKSRVTIKRVSPLNLRYEAVQALAQEFVCHPVLPKEFDRHSQTQRTQAGDPLFMVEICRDETLLDAGRGTGQLGMEAAGSHGFKKVHGIDRNRSMVQAARDLAYQEGLAGVLQFELRDILEYTSPGNLDTVISDNAMHWIKSGRAPTAYRQLHDVLRPSTGVLAVHKGGEGTYQSFTARVREVVRKLGLEDRFSNWTYLVFYPLVDQLRQLQKQVAFVHLTVKPVETSGRENTTLIEDHAHAGLEPFLKQLEWPMRQKRFRDTFLRRAAIFDPGTSAFNLCVVANRR